MDIWDKEKRSAVMAKIRGKDTRPEWIVRRYLFSHGYRYRKNLKSLPGSPDIVLPKYGLVIFVHGCFWHGHEEDSHIPKSHTGFWQQKIENNRRRDQRNKAELLRMGWSVLTIWECQLRPALRERTLREMESRTPQSSLDLLHKKAEHKAQAGKRKQTRFQKQTKQASKISYFCQAKSKRKTPLPKDPCSKRTKTI